MGGTWLLDAFIRGDNDVVFALFDEGSKTIEERSASLCFYGYIVVENPQAVVAELQKVNDVEDAWVEAWRAPPYYTNTVSVVVFKTRKYRVLKELLRAGALKGVQVVNTFPHPLVEALYRAGIRPLSRLRGWTRGYPSVLPWDPIDEDPPVDYLMIGHESGYYVLETPSRRELFWDLEDLASSAISERFHLGFTHSYIYAKLVDLQPKIASSAHRWVIGGTFDPHVYFTWSRLSYTPLSLMSNVTIGKVLATLESLLARDKRLINDKSTGRVEPWRNIEDLLVSDRGGVVYQPRPGLYWDVCQVDFRSLYPSIIAKFNISGETVNRRPCNNELKFAWTPHRVCTDEEGIVPSSIRELLNIKDLYESLARKTGLILYERRREAVKWILVASFGYLGYRNSLFGSIAAHEVVTSTSREIMRLARLVAERRGYRVLHAIVDSLFISGVQSVEECEKIREEIERETEFRAKVEAHYKWLYIPRCIGGHYGASNKYYGLMSDGTWKVRGVIAVRRDTPLLVRKAQLEALEKLFTAKTPKDMYAKVEEAHAVVDSYIELLKCGVVDPRMLTISRGFKVGGEYRRPLAYILESSPPFRLIYVSSKLVPFSGERSKRIDVYKYIKLLERAKKELPFSEDIKVD